MAVLQCPVCQKYQVDGVDGDSRGFLLADHFMVNHLKRWPVSRALECFCGTVMSANITVVMAHFKQYGGVAEHYRAWQLGVDP